MNHSSARGLLYVSPIDRPLSRPKTDESMTICLHRDEELEAEMRERKELKAGVRE